MKQDCFADCFGSGTLLCIAAAAQDHPEGSAVTNPSRYSSASKAAPSANQVVLPELLLPAGTLVKVRLSDLLSSARNNAGDGFTAILDQPLVAQGWVAARRGQTVVGQVAATQKAERIQGVSQLALELTDLQKWMAVRCPFILHSFRVMPAPRPITFWAIEFMDFAVMGRRSSWGRGRILAVEATGITPRNAGRRAGKRGFRDTPFTQWAIIQSLAV
jgi:hypothetical protein